VTRPSAEPRSGPVTEALLSALAARGPGPHTVVDAGGGTGGVAVPLALAGHQVTVIDPSPDSLAALERRAAEAGVAELITARQGDLDDLAQLVPPASVDVLLCHGVLDMVADRAVALGLLATALVPAGLLSVLTSNRVALVVQRAMAGRFADATTHLLPAEPGPVDLEELLALLARTGFGVTDVMGVRTLGDLVPSALRERDPAATTQFRALERAASQHPALRAIASQLHVLATRL
jgi:SAM-dependent methyltransferase